MTCKIEGCSEPQLTMQLCTAHAVLFCHLIDGDIELPYFDRMSAMPINDMLKELNKRFPVPRS